MNADRKQSQTQFNKQRMIDAAEKLFLSGGTEKTLMDDIAKEAGFAKSTVYVYFASKEEIYNEIILRGMTRLKEEFADIAALKLSFADKFYRLCFTLADFKRNYPLYFDGLLQSISLDFSDKEDGVLRRIFNEGERLSEIVGAILCQGIQGGCVKPDIKIKETIFAFWAGISGIVRLAEEKTAYLEKHLHTTADDFMRYGFSLLLGAIRADEKEGL